MSGHTVLRASTASVAAAAATLLTSPALAATWSGSRTTPNLAEMFAIDATGEPGWLYGQEDVAGDGLTTFTQPEQSIDIRTAYAAPDSQALWLRVYVSDTATPGGNINAYFFINTDGSSTTGSSAAASTIDAKFTTDSSAGGYEYVLGIKGNGAVIGTWAWTGSQWLSQAGSPTVEVGTDLDPIRINGDTHGYLQVRVLLSAIGLTAACNAQIYVRTTNDTGSLGEGDLEVGQVGTCDPSDTDVNDNGIADPLEPQSACTSDAQCPGGGICLSEVCHFAPPCVDATDCQSDEECTSEGICSPRATGTCGSNADCGDLVCEFSRCSACMPGGIQCGDGRLCAPTGRCVTDPDSGGTGGAAGSTGAGGSAGSVAGGTGGSAGTGGSGGSGGSRRTEDPPLEPGPGEDVKGGACACSAPGSRRFGTTAVTSLLFVLALCQWRRRSRSYVR